MIRFVYQIWDIFTFFSIEFFYWFVLKKRILVLIRIPIRININILLLVVIQIQTSPSKNVYINPHKNQQNWASVCLLFRLMFPVSYMKYIRRTHPTTQPSFRTHSIIRYSKWRYLFARHTSMPLDSIGYVWHKLHRIE